MSARPPHFLLFLVLAFSSVKAQTSDELLSLDSLLNLRISSASKYEQTISEAPASVTIITRDEIRAYGYQDLGEVLSQVRDLYISYDRDYTYLGVRGFSRPTDYNNRIGVMVNGSLINENMWGTAPVGAEFLGLDIDFVERIEIIRGPGSALYGNSPMLGMINIVTSTPKSLTGLQASVIGGSYGLKQASLEFGKALPNGMEIAVGGRLGQTKGQQLYFPEYDDSLNDGIADHRDWLKYGGVQAHITWKGFSWQTVYSNRTGGLSTGSYGVIFNDSTGYLSDQFGMTELKFEREISNRVSFSARAYGNFFQFYGEYPYDSSLGGNIPLKAQSVYAGAEARARWDITETNRLVAGIEGIRHLRSYYFQGNSSGILWTGNFPYTVFSAYAQDEWQPATWLSFTLGGRFDRLYLGRTAITPRLAALFFPSKRSTIKLLYGEAFRAPTVYEYNVDDPLYARPNFDLQSERVRTLEANVQHRLGQSVLITAAAFYNQMTDLIDQVEDENDGLLQYQNVGRADGFGASAELTWRFGNTLHGYANYSYQHMQADQTGQRLTNSPIHLGRIGTSVRFAKHFTAALEANAQSGRLTLQGQFTSPFVLLNGQVGIDPSMPSSLFLDRISLHLRVRNVLNTSYGYPGGFEHVQDIIMQNRRNIFLKLQVELF